MENLSKRQQSDHRSDNKQMHVQVRNIRVVIHSFDVFSLLILPFDKGLFVLHFPQSSVF